MKIKRFAALSLNPALDITMWIDGLDKEYNQVRREQCEAAGKAVNVARVLGAFDCECRTLIVAGEDNSHYYFERLKEDAITYEAITVPGLIRENISLVQPDGTLVRLARPGFTVDKAALERVRGQFAPYVAEGTLVVVAGKNPAGVAPEDFVAMCRSVKELGGTLALDTSSLHERDIFEIAPWIIKPNVEELELMTGETFGTLGQMTAALCRFHEHGVEHVLVSMGGDGLLYSGAGETLLAKVPSVTVKSTVGAGDNTLSGFLMAYAQGRALEECVRIAASFGTASVMRDGTNPARVQELREVYDKVKVSRLG